MPSFTFTSGTSWVVPNDCQKIDTFDCTGGGGNGSAGVSGTWTSASGGHGGAGGVAGGAGARAIKNNIAVTPGETLTIYVGTAGTYSGLYRNSTATWLCLAYSGNGQTGGSPSVYDTGFVGGNGASGGAGQSAFVSGGVLSLGDGGVGGSGAGSQAYGGGGPGGVGGSGVGGPSNGNPGSSASNYGGGGGGGGGGSGASAFAGDSGGPGGAGFQGISTLSYTPIIPPTVTSVSPPSGQISGGDSVVITGTHFDLNVSQVWFGASSAFAFTVNSATQITAITPPHVKATVDVTVVNQYTTSATNVADQFTFSFNNWADNAALAPGLTLGAQAGVKLPIRTKLTPATSVRADTTTPQQYLSALFASESILSPSFDQPKGIAAGLSASNTFGAATAGAKSISTLLQPNAKLATSARQAQRIKTTIALGAGAGAVLGLKASNSLAARLINSTGIVAKPNLPEAIGLRVAIHTGFVAHEIPVKFIGALIKPQAGLAIDATYVSYVWNTYGSQVLYAASSGLEKAMIDADTPRVTAIPAEVVTDTWDPYACPIELLPYLAWAMGVNFWNANWSEDTKRAWIASQWQFKALRGTDAAIDMAVDFAGRDVSPYGYSVRKIITQPQGQYPSPGVTNEAQETWLASLPQVRVYQAAQLGQAYPEEFYCKVSFLGTSSWSAQTYMTPDTAKERLGKRAVWNVHGQDVSDVVVTDFGNYFQLHMPGQAAVEELYSDAGWIQYSYLTPSDAWKRLVTIAPDTVSPYRIAVGPSLRAVEAQAALVAQPGIAGYDVFVGSNFHPYDDGGVFMAPRDLGELSPRELDPVQKLPAFPSYFMPDTSGYRLFYRYPVYDPDDLPTGGTQGTMFMGVGWLDWPPFTAEVDVFMAGTRCPAEFDTTGFMLPNGRYLIPQDERPVAYVSGAIEAARKLTDLTLLQPKPTPDFSAGKPFIAGRDHFTVGQPELSA